MDNRMLDWNSPRVNNTPFLKGVLSQSLELSACFTFYDKKDLDFGDKIKLMVLRLS